MSINMRKDMINEGILKNRFAPLTEEKLNHYIQKTLGKGKKYAEDEWQRKSFDFALTGNFINREGTKTYKLNPIITDRKKFIDYMNKALPVVTGIGLGTQINQQQKKRKK